ncbi:hypothetical protein JHK87_016854 [Glycine soja]|nr:hypothetical protein JHK87_016854 [Glycine soja]
MDAQPPESAAPAASTEDFVHVADLKMESLSESIVRIDEPSEADAAASSAPAESDRRPATLPPELSRNVRVLSCESSAEGGVCDVYLVGTAHVSEESSREVQAIVNFLKPQVVFLELCSSRVAVLTLQNLKIASKLEVFPGSEFRVAYEEAIKYGGRVILGDRPVQLNEMDDSDMLTLVIQEMSKEFPTLMETLVHERDQMLQLTLVIPVCYNLAEGSGVLDMVMVLTSSAYPSHPNDLKSKYHGDPLPLYLVKIRPCEETVDDLRYYFKGYMSSTLLKVASENSSVVAVVGKGHLQGIKKHWKQPVMKDLMTVPSPKPVVSATRIVTSVGAAVAGVSIISGIYLSCKK